ncbi:hypothetical protein BDF14DRAFT_1840826 [Spinellus fusiger]|nr:hypothetical protein BDF14DRAFT_1840826 [Spinellus fusiger]
MMSYLFDSPTSDVGAGCFIPLLLLLLILFMALQQTPPHPTETGIDSQERVSHGVGSFLGSVLCDIDKSVIAVHQSQDELGKEIERIVTELEEFNTMPEPPRLQPTLDKLVDARKRLTIAQKSMQQTQTRLQRLQVALDAKKGSLKT